MGHRFTTIMASVNESLQTLDGDLKVVYGTALIKTLPAMAILQKRFTLSDSKDFPMPGEYFSALIAVQNPWGFSYLGTGYENTANNVVLNDALAGQTAPAKIYPNMTVLADNIQYQVLDRAAKAGDGAVMSALTLTGTQMALQARNVLEIQALHGQQGIGVVSGPISTLTVTLSAGSSAVGMVSILKGARVQFIQADNATARTAFSNSNYLTVDTFNTDNPDAITITFVETGTTHVADVTTGDLLFLGGTRGVTVAQGDTCLQYEQIGLGVQLSQLTGAVFSISKTQYAGAWKANVKPSIGQFSPSVLMEAAAISLNRGGQLGKYLAILSPRSWGVLNAALATNEVYNQQAPNFTMSKKSGTNEITIFHAGIEIECVPHAFQKDGQYFLFPSDQVKRIGSLDLSFSIPGRSGDEEFYYPASANVAAMQRQCRADWQIALLTPPSGVIGTGITY